MVAEPKRPKDSIDPLDEDDDLLEPETMEAPPGKEEVVGTVFDEEVVRDAPELDPSGEAEEGEPSDLPDLNFWDGKEDEEQDALDSDEGQGSEIDEDRMLDDTQEEDRDDDLDEGPTKEWGEISEEMLEDELPEEDWVDLEDEGQSLPPGRALIGLKEYVSLPALGLLDLVARCDTGQERSVIHAEVETLSPGKIRLSIGDEQVEVRGEEEAGHLVVRVRLCIGGVGRTMSLRVVAREEAVPIVLGRDALEGFFVVDVANNFTYGREGTA